MLEKVDLTLKLEKDEYKEELTKQQLKLVRILERMRKEGIPIAIMFEGWDAGGKGSCIKRITEKVDPRGFRVLPIGAPTDNEKAHHYLWRFWTRLPGRGEMVIFDRSWYGRVLVERVEGYARPEEWQRAYREIREFERMLTADGMVVIKFWLHISKDEQLKRFKEREKDPFKQYKIGPDDWRNRERWDDYINAAEDMFTHTDLANCPWHLVSGEDERYARVETIRIVIKRCEEALECAG